MPAACQLRDVSCRIGDKQILEHISLEVGGSVEVRPVMQLNL